ncbi:hypothetical protein GCM10011386_33910 [Parapedobacter defluvii]|uniref:mRNA interferase RelE/StbE n=1 Tax=Parapedobacter defluvii TaxID=2045106 RepID=A0ABQ1MDI3_9SPHI|nr:type II toxin-antitoxin system RelE/ParE family toxin [Parapedobacter defluvii]RQP13881.1 MAG: type II toxin-antitoxin system RelE/ParE family toxin [Parapedobacter sp.]GGC39001.1 hypothetical protein GCM10011386_33910 [Parapedobacter defluvii]
MPKYAVVLTKKAEKQLDKLPDQIASSILQSISSLADNPRPFGYKKLKGRDAYRIRSGDYRIIYEIVDSQLIIDVIAIGHRKNIYE